MDRQELQLGGKFAELKLRLEDRSAGDLQLLESLEVLSLGSRGSMACGVPWRLRRRTRPHSGWQITNDWRNVPSSTGTSWKGCGRKRPAKGIGSRFAAGKLTGGTQHAAAIVDR